MYHFTRVNDDLHCNYSSCAGISTISNVIKKWAKMIYHITLMCICEQV